MTLRRAVLVFALIAAAPPLLHAQSPFQPSVMVDVSRAPFRWGDGTILHAIVPFEANGQPGSELLAILKQFGLVSRRLEWRLVVLVPTAAGICLEHPFTPTTLPFGISGHDQMAPTVADVNGDGLSDVLLQSPLGEGPVNALEIVYGKGPQRCR